MANPRRRLGEADAIFLPMGAAVGGEMAPASVQVLAGPLEPQAEAHQRELQARLLPAMRRRIVRDRLSPALPRWVDVPGAHPDDGWMALAPPGDGSLRGVLDWAGRWAALPLPPERPPWRAVRFDGVEVDGVGGRTVIVHQVHHALIDGGGARRMVEHLLRFDPDAPLAPLPPLEPPEDLTAWERWKEGWALEGRKARATAQAASRRLRWAAQEPGPALARAKELAGAVRRIQEPVGAGPLSPALRRRSDRLRFDELEVDLADLKAGARAAGGSINDGFMAAVSLGLRRWHRDLGVDLPALRTAMAINRRSEGTGWEGNDVLAVVLLLPLDDEDPARLVKRCREVSLRQREDDDALWLLDRVRALGNRLPFALSVAIARRSMAGLDLSLSNVVGLSKRRWTGHQEILREIPLAVGTLSGLAMVMTSRGPKADLGLTSCPEAIPDGEHLLRRLAEGFAEVADLAR